MEEGEAGEEAHGDMDRRGPGYPGTGKGLSGEQRKNMELVKELMLSLDVEDGLDEIHTFRWVVLEVLCNGRIIFLNQHEVF